MSLAIAAAVLLTVWQTPALAQDEAIVDVSDQDCSAILESYAADPKSVAKPLADACERAMMVAPGAGGPADDPLRARANAADPCAGPNAGDSVRCWGPWPTLAPAAGGAGAPGADILPPDIEQRQEVLAANGPGGGTDPGPEFPLAPCQAGLPCGFATIVDGPTGYADSEDTTFARIALADDGNNFVIENDDVVIESDPDMNVVIEPENNGLAERLLAGRATLAGIFQGDTSILQARIVRDAETGAIIAAGDYWGDGEGEGAQSGNFAWGRTLDRSLIDNLVSGDGTLSFSGQMSVDRSTFAQIALNYGASPSWTGNWTNPNYNFSAGGQVQDANFVSDSSQFSDNVQDGFVQGALVGGDEGAAAAHIFEVVLDGQGLIRDVGLLARDGVAVVE
ncbi:MAG: hypothetical protein KJP03_02175 [Gammaproteobacteria bacterium]|nr:hypothetical protein [Gammaproteobacteria bacterium]